MSIKMEVTRYQRRNQKKKKDAKKQKGSDYTYYRDRGYEKNRKQMGENGQGHVTKNDKKNISKLRKQE